MAVTSGLCLTTVWKEIKELRDDEEAHIGKWEKNARGKWMPFYVAGPGVDAPEPEGVRAPYISQEELLLPNEKARELAKRNADMMAKIQHNWASALWMAAA